MKILLTLNKTYRNYPDTGYWYTYRPLIELGHQVYWHDTVNPEVKDYNKVVEHLKPDLIFCCLTGNRAITPYEPWETIRKETASGRTKTFNWFCDDTWRFEGGSSEICWGFTACSTPEPNYVEKYKSIGYENILLASWHANSNFYFPKPFLERDIEASFIGALSPARERFFEQIDVSIEKIFGISNKEMFETHSRTKIGINLSVNQNDPVKGTQMKQRIFEIAAGGGLILSEYHDGIEEFFDIDKEIITFKTPEEFKEKINFLSKNESVVRRVAKNGHKRFLAEHDSKIRLAKLLKEIKEI